MTRAKSTKAKSATNAKKASVSETSLVLRVCASNMTSHNEFKWPGVGEVASAPDWAATKECGSGLHGWLYGAGDHGCTSYHGDDNAKWLVVEVGTASIIQLGEKVKFPYGTVRFVGDRKDATDYLLANEPRALNVAVIGAQRQVGDKESVMVGALGTATAGDSGTATAGDSGTATAGYRGTATAGYRGTATAGEFGEIRIRWWDEKNSRYRTVIGYVGENGIKPKVAYRLDVKQEFVEVAS
jgi:hypothetical protein